MRLWPVILDCQPSYLCDRNLTLLLAPLGTENLLAHLYACLEPITNLPLLIVTPGGVDTVEHRKRMLPQCPKAAEVCAQEEFADTLASHDLSDALLIVDSRLLPVRGIELSRLVHQYAEEARVVHHLVAFETGLNGTRERVCFDATGHVRGIQRHYEAATWPCISGVSATVLPVACGVMGERLVPQTLAGLRAIMAARGTPARDLPLTGAAFDLTEQSGFLAANERFILKAIATGNQRHREDTIICVGGGQLLHPTARVMGPVVIHADAVIEEHATVVGPAVVGAGARIAKRAFVAHAVIGAGCSVPMGAAVHDRTWFDSGDVLTPLNEPPTPSYLDRLERPILERHTDHTAKSSDRLRYVQLKRVLDAAIAGLSLLLLAPVMLAIALMIALQADGPMFYGDEREGLEGRAFRCWKFRTMTDRAAAVQQDLNGLDQVDGPHFKVARDPRVTSLGRLLRASNLDELPQLWNVLLGEMSLVGPRPSPFRENQICVPWREARISVRPGITGLWQVCRHDRTSADFHQWIEYDVLYVQHVSFLLDLKIVAGTILTLGGKVTHLRPSWLIPAIAVDATLSDQTAA
jgi:lipopolysaccharide/colanic/teichoic acid biosynthesis glycosyltransferase